MEFGVGSNSVLEYLEGAATTVKLLCTSHFGTHRDRRDRRDERIPKYAIHSAPFHGSFSMEDSKSIASAYVTST